MATLHKTYFLECKTSVHAGDGSSTGTIDNPIQREITTGFPVFRDSTVRGAVRELFESDVNLKGKPEFTPTFGNKDNGDQASALDVFPARLLFLPVRSLKGIFGYVTCPFVINRFIDEMKQFHQVTIAEKCPDIESGKALFASNLNINNKLGLEEFLFNEFSENYSIDILINYIPHINRLKTHWAIIDDTSFAYFTQLFTEKVTRNKIDIETGVAKDGALFNEEHLPEESILYTTFGFSNEFSLENSKPAEKIKDYFTDNFKELFQLGGNKSIGKGLVQVHSSNFNENNTEQ